MIKRWKKLVVNKETLRVLRPDELAVAGGVPPKPFSSGYSGCASCGGPGFVCGTR